MLVTISSVAFQRSCSFLWPRLCFCVVAFAGIDSCDFVKLLLRHRVKFGEIKAFNHAGCICVDVGVGVVWCGVGEGGVLLY